MARRTIIAASILAIFTMSSPAFAYSNVSPKEAPQKVTSMHQSPTVDDAPFWTSAPDNYRYHGGPKSND
jgi:hypothetical protein